VPKQLGLPFFVLAQGLPDPAYILFASALVALGCGIVRTV